jgi:hypothetical protein
MGVQVTFNYQAWASLFPSLVTIPQPLVNGIILTLAQGYCRNDGSGPVNDPVMQLNLLNLMVAHIAVLFFGQNGNAPSTLVGRITSAGEGSVNVSTEMPSTPNRGWYDQTPYGSAFYELSSNFMSAVYIPGPRRRW